MKEFSYNYHFPLPKPMSSGGLLYIDDICICINIRQHSFSIIYFVVTEHIININLMSYSSRHGCSVKDMY